MNFERNKDTKAAIRIGIKRNARHLDYIWSNLEATNTLSDLETEEFFKNIDNYIKKYTLKPFYAIFIGDPSQYNNLMKLRGQWIIFKNKFYQIPE